MAITPITDKMTPAQIDNILVNAMWAKTKAQTGKESATQSLEMAEERVANYTKLIGRGNTSGSSYYRERKALNEEKIASLKERIKETSAIVTETSAQINACDKEFQRRGGWTRFWIVTNTNGHIHTSLSCSTCFPSTRYAWLPDLAGSKNEHIVELAGESACTVCFPDAPVDTRYRPSQIEEPARKAAREEREAKAAAKAEKARQKGISNPDGTELKIRGHWSRIKTEAEAQRLYVNARVSLLLHETKHHVIHNSSYLEEIEENAATLLPALTHKRGTTEEEERTALEKKVIAKIKREWKITL
ncbi:MAG: hypothetical protein H9W81_01025 [Enterococcus sp.]|nr:hypothetical protein [Enterococcus sp.]